MGKRTAHCTTRVKRMKLSLRMLKRKLLSRIQYMMIMNLFRKIQKKLMSPKQFQMTKI